ncbi:MAG: HYR domain-containing protein, partial [Bacteroidales bacterium]|nr:HYR domain-containing protein [Bacteroidales bacterium]
MAVKAGLRNRRTSGRPGYLSYGVLLMLLFFAAGGYGQDYYLEHGFYDTIPPDTVHLSCGDTVYFYDSGGPIDPYLINEDYRVVFISSTSGNHIRITFTYFETQNNQDRLEIIDSDLFKTSLGIFDGTNTPPEITSTGSYLEFYFSSNHIVNYGGWASMITVKDVEAPLITGCPGNITQNIITPSICDTLITWTEPAATDNCTSSGDLVWNKSHLPGTDFPAGTTTVTYTVTDKAGNESICSFDVIVTENVPPTASNPLPINVQCSDDVPIPDVTVVTDEADNCTAAPVVAFVSDVSNGLTCPETITRTYSVTDESGNSINVTQTITVNDTQAPTASNPLPINVQCSVDVPAPDVTVVTDETDNCTAAPVVAFVSDVSDNAYCPETIIRTYSVTDGCNNSIEVYQTITIIPSTPPAEIGGPVSTSGGTVECLADATAPAALPVVEDACGNVLTPAGPAHGGTYDGCEGTYTWVYTYTDCAGNDFDWTYTYTIDRTTPPEEVGGPVSTDGGTVACLTDATAPTILPVVEDVCGNVLTPAAPTNGGDYDGCEGTYTWVYRYTDCAGNYFDWIYTYTIEYTGALTPPSNGSATVACPSEAVDPGPLPYIPDACGRMVAAELVGSVSVPDPLDCEGTVVWTYRYTACDGTTTADWTFTYTIDRTTPPAEVGGPVSTDGGTVACLADATEPTTLPV